MKEEKFKHKIPDWAIKRKIDFRCLCEGECLEDDLK
jgi:hypothetical protein